jgi:hypothetical protein
MYKNGMAQLEGFLFSKSICFEDINYELRDNEDKKSVFKKLSDVYNFFTEDMHVQMTYMNTRVPQDEINEMLKIKSQGEVHGMCSIESENISPNNGMYDECPCTYFPQPGQDDAQPLHLTKELSHLNQCYAGENTAQAPHQNIETTKNDKNQGGEEQPRRMKPGGTAT